MYPALILTMSANILNGAAGFVLRLIVNGDAGPCDTLPGWRLEVGVAPQVGNPAIHSRKLLPRPGL